MSTLFDLQQQYSRTIEIREFSLLLNVLAKKRKNSDYVRVPPEVRKNSSITLLKKMAKSQHTLLNLQAIAIYIIRILLLGT